MVVSAACILGRGILEAMDSNPNVLLLGLEGGQYLLRGFAGMAALLAVAVLGLIVRHARTGLRRPLTWLAMSGSACYLMAIYLIVFD